MYKVKKKNSKKKTNYKKYILPDSVSIIQIV